MRFHEAAAYLFDMRRFPQRPGTHATTALLSHLEDPHEDVPTVQIAGSNGKGSTARMVESTLREAGLDVGLYTSPHLHDLRERVRINGRKISKSAIVSFVETVDPYITDNAAEGTAPTFFETVTAMALWEFARQDVDVAILEVGIGGTHDATSVVDPLASAVTSVALEHTSILGEDLDTIARDMAGIAPADRPLVTAATGEALDALEDETGQPVVVADDARAGDIRITYRGRDGIEGCVTLEGDNWTIETKLALLGAHQARNAGVAVGILEQLADAGLFSFEAETIARGLRNAHWPGRFEILSHEPLVVLDGAHNPRGCETVAETLETFDFENLYLVTGIKADKDLRGIASAFDPDHVIATAPDHDQAEDPAAIATAFERETDASVTTRGTVADALADALAAAGPADCVFVTGSLFTVAEARNRWTRPAIPKRVDSIETARALLEGADVTSGGVWRMRGKATHRVLKTRVRPKQARYLKEEMLSLGGECAISSATDEAREPVDVVLMGTMAQFKRLCEKLDDQSAGLAPLAHQLRNQLGIASSADAGSYPWAAGTAVMGILNVTPDSFHDGGQYEAEADAIARAEAMVEDGADIIDVGGESTRPGADPVPVEEEKARVLPVIERLADLDVMVSIDTRKAEVARAALEAGADILNDVSGLADPEMRLLAAEYDVPIVVMHSIDTPVDPENEIEYDDVVEDVIDELTERILLAEKAGLDRSQIIVDPGLGFGKSAAESFALLDRIGEFRALGCPVLVGHSHKSMFEYVGKDGDERYDATIAGTALAASRGADIVRVHDVAGNADAVDVIGAARDAAYDT